MGVRRKSRRKIVCGGKEYVWYVLADDRDYWERVSLNDWNTAFLHIVSEDKALVLTIPLNAPKPYVVSKGRIFQGKPASGHWGRYLLPFGIPRAVTPRFVANVIKWASASDGSGGAVSQDWGGELQY